MCTAKGGVLALLVLALGLATPVVTRAASTLDKGTVAPTEGTTETLFAFSVEYTSDQPNLPEVWAEVGEIRVDMTPDPPGLGVESITYRGESTLQAGDWTVVFYANGNVEPHVGPNVTVQDARATPSPTLSPTARPTPRPSPTPTSRPTPVPTTPPTPTPTPTPTPAPQATPGGFAFTPSPTRTHTPHSPTPTATAQPEIASAGARLAFGPVLMLFIGGTALGSGAALLGVYWVGRRRRAPHRAA